MKFIYFLYDIIYNKILIRLSIMRGAGYILDLLIKIDKKKYYLYYPIKIEDGRIFYGNLNNIRYRSLFWKRVHEPIESELLALLLNADDVFYDIGANIGWYATLAAQILKKGKVYAFEPVEIVANDFRINIEKNRYQNIILENIALADYEGDAIINFNLDNWGLSSLQVSSPKTKQVNIKVRTLDDYIKENKIKKVSIIKCDIEGAELLFLNGAYETIMEFMPIIFMEISPDNLK
ncbi:MAG: FkbM family methyltransferase, partial [Ignavibacteriaceae bacterium]